MSFQKIGTDGRPLGAPQLAAFLDEKTGLMWAALDASEKSMTHTNAMKAHVGFRCAGFDDWYLPSIEELGTLCDRTLFKPAADPALGLKSDFYWSSTIAPAASPFSGCAWNVGFNYGESSLHGKSLKAFVRLVRRAGASQ